MEWREWLVTCERATEGWGNAKSRWNGWCVWMLEWVMGSCSSVWRPLYPVPWLKTKWWGNTCPAFQPPKSTPSDFDLNWEAKSGRGPSTSEVIPNLGEPVPKFKEIWLRYNPWIGAVTSTAHSNVSTLLGISVEYQHAISPGTGTKGPSLVTITQVSLLNDVLDAEKLACEDGDSTHRNSPDPVRIFEILLLISYWGKMMILYRANFHKMQISLSKAKHLIPGPRNIQLPPQEKNQQ